MHGKTIQLDRETGLAEGQIVSVMISPALKPGEGLRRAFGAWANDSEGFDAFLQGIYRDREGDRQEPDELFGRMSPSVGKVGTRRHLRLTSRSVLTLNELP
jgi:hypothetical protein